MAEIEKIKVLTDEEIAERDAWWADRQARNLAERNTAALESIAQSQRELAHIAAENTPARRWERLLYGSRGRSGVMRMNYS